jgi:hypothetical protein
VFLKIPRAATERSRGDAMPKRDLPDADDRIVC